MLTGPGFNAEGAEEKGDLRINKNFIPYIGGKNNLIGQISKRLHATGKKCLVDVFGGSAAITLRSGFKKRIYNDINGDIVNLFRTMADEKQRMALLKQLKWTPPSREIYEGDRQIHKNGDHSFKQVSCSITRARMTFYRHIFCFGGKTRTGGFVVSVSDRKSIKEILKYKNVLRSLSEYGKFFQETVIENLDFVDLIEKYGNKENIVLFIDPPYPGFTTYYSHNLSNYQHEQLANILITVPAPVICTFYNHSIVRKNYPEDLWKYEIVKGMKNNQQGGNKESEELILTKKELSRDQISRYLKNTETQGSFVL